MAMGWSASLPYPGEKAPEFATLENGILTYTASSLFSEANVARLFTEMPKTFAGFAPLGLVLTIMMGAAVAERSGMFSALIRLSLRNAHKSLLTPIVAESRYFHAPSSLPTPVRTTIAAAVR